MSKEAMKLALEAAYLAGFNASGEGYNGEYPFRDHARNPEEDAAWIKDRDNALREALAEQPAQQEQEPGVAVFELQESGWEIICDGDWIQTLPLRTKLYTSPQPAQRKPWVGLTQQDIDIAFDDTQEGGGFDDFARAIEAKLREKNQ